MGGHGTVPELPQSAFASLSALWTSLPPRGALGKQTVTSPSPTSLSHDGLWETPPLRPQLWLQPCLCHRCPHTAQPGLHGWGKGTAVGTSGRQAPGQASSCHSGAYRSQQLVPRGVACFPTHHPPSGGWRPRCSLRCHMGESPWGDAQRPRAQCQPSEGLVHQMGEPPRPKGVSSRAPPVPLLQGLVAGRLMAV